MMGQKILFKKMFPKVLAFLILIAIVVYSSFFGRTFFQNKKTQPAKAANFSSDTFIGLDKTYDYKGSVEDIEVDGATVTLDGEHTFKDVTIKNGGKITHSAVSTKGLFPGYSPDNFTARWKGFIQIPSDVRKLYVPADDGARILLRKTSETRWLGSDWSGVPSVSVSEGLYEIEVDYYESTGHALIYLKYRLSTRKLYPVPSSWLYLKQDKLSGTCGTQTGVNGLCGEYFANHYPNNPFSGPPTLTRIDSQINFTWGSDSPFPSVGDNFTARWKGFVELPEEYGDNQGIGTYSDNGVMIRLKKVLPDSWANWQEWSNWSDSWTGSTFTGYNLSPGLYEIDLQYIEGIGNAFIKLLGYYKSGSSELNYVLSNSQLFLNQDKISGTCGFQTGVNGLCGEYFAFRSITSPFPSESEEPYLSNLTRIDQEVNFDWGTDHPFIGGLRLKILGKLTLDGGYIDVSEKGYPGGVGWGDNDVTPGYGPGGGNRYTEENYELHCGTHDDIGGGGGGYGGKGAPGRGYYSAEGGRIYGTKDTPQTAPDELDLYDNKVPAIFGSGGAGGIHEWCDITGHNHDYYTGGKGGGSIILDVAGDVELTYNYDYPWAGIYANGGPGKGYSGGGSGGLIYIKSRGLWKSDVGGQPIVWGGSGAGDGTTWNVQTNTVSLAGYGGRIQAKGGDGYGTDCPSPLEACGGGGGGRIVIDAPLGPSRTVNKSPLATPVINDGNLKTYTITYNSGTVEPFGAGGYKIVDELPQGVSYSGSDPPYNNCYSQSGQEVTWDLSNPACPSYSQHTFNMYVSLDRKLCNTTIINQIYIIDEQGLKVSGSEKWVSNYVECVAFSGDIFAGSLGSLTNPSGGDIVSTRGNAPVFGTWKIGNYVMSSPADWAGIQRKVDDTVGRLKKYNKGCSPVDHPNQLSTGNSPPEGEIYYCSGSNVPSFAEQYSGKGTFIVNGNLTISHNIDYAASDPNASLGVIVLGDITINPEVNSLKGAYFATGNITFNGSSANFTGLLAGSTIKLPQYGSFSYDPRIATNQPPGFREIFKALYQEAAP